MRRVLVLIAIAFAPSLSGCRRQVQAQRTDGGSTPARRAVSDASPSDAALELTRPDAHVRIADAGARRLRLDTPIDIGPAVRLTAISDGALIRTKADDLVWLAFERPKERPPTEAIDPEVISAIPAPAITRGSRAYWVSGGRLVRRCFSRTADGQANAGPLEVLANDAQDVTRVAARTVDGAPPRDLVSYIARPTTARGDRRARIWVENASEGDASGEAGRSFVLSDEGAGASSVALAGVGTRTWAVSLDARIAMSPLHARTIDLVDRNAMKFGEDVVVFVGEAEAAHTETDLAISDGEPVAFVPLPKDAGGFGLASVAFGREPRLDSQAVWTMYPNGLKLPLFAVGHLCGEQWVAYVRPTEATPKAPSILVVAPLDGFALGPEVAVVTAMRFTSLAFAPGDDGAPPSRRKAGWLAWSADGRTLACSMRCR
jgi:hypothetical protein